MRKRDEFLMTAVLCAMVMLVTLSVRVVQAESYDPFGEDKPDTTQVQVFYDPLGDVCPPECKCGCIETGECTCLKLATKKAAQKTPPCSAQCTCGCQEGLPCTCGDVVIKKAPIPAPIAPAPVLLWIPTYERQPTFMIRQQPQRMVAPMRRGGNC